MKNFKLKDLMLSIRPSRMRMTDENNTDVLYESPENWLMQNDACVDQGTKSCSPPSGDCPDNNKTSCSPPSSDCPTDNRTSCSPPSSDCPKNNRTSCSPPSGKIDDQLNFENDGIAINELKKSIAALQRLS